MNIAVISNWFKRAVNSIGGKLVLGILLCLSGAGCSDHRISQTEFQRMQEDARKTTLATTQPAANRVMETAKIERSLGPYRVGVSDVLSITLITALEQATLSPPILVRVDRNGEITLPLVGNIKLAGLELQDVDMAIRKAYIPKIYRDLAVYVDVPRPQTTNVLVTGAVATPGLIPLRRSERDLLHAIVGAGGASDLASGNVTLKRIRGSEEVSLNIYNPQDLKTALSIAPLENGDIITVQAATPNIVFVGGLVNAPRSQSYPPGAQLTVLQALAASGGLRTDIFPHEGTLIRRMPDGRDVHVKLNLDRIQNGKDANIALAAGDILWVPYTWDTRAEDWISRNIYIRAGASVNYNVSGVEYMNRQAKQSGGSSNQNQQNSFDPFGFLNQGSAISNLVARPAAQ
ncbi:MAG: polysaccharide biosynthesis/export family protein [Phycisphaerae bacterium]